jgi:hypothetical protein
MYWEDTFRSWAKPPGETEQAKCDNAVRAVRKAIDASLVLQSRKINVFAQGSYCNRTNVRQDSDVDICILCADVCFVDYSMSEGLTDADVGLVDHPYKYAEFKSDVGQALRSYFGSSQVVQGHKAFDIHENSYRVDADAVACFEYRRYHRRNDGTVYFYSGTQFLPDNGGRIINWPQQNYDNGVAKNTATSQRFKAVVRILKHLRNKMADENIAVAVPIPSFLIECLVWNVPSEGFGHDTYTADVRWALAHLFNNTRQLESCSEWGEINELKYLFRSSQAWNMEQAHAFVDAAWNYLGFD